MHKLLPFLICVVIVSCGKSAQHQYMIGVSQCSNDEWCSTSISDSISTAKRS